jgi:chaperonin GroEL (HSP60 family)
VQIVGTSEITVLVILPFQWKLLWELTSLVLQMPAYTIAHNAGVEGAVVVGKLLEQANLNIGYDAAKGLSLSSLISIYLIRKPIECMHVERRAFSCRINFT